MAKDYKEIFNKLIADMKLKKSLGIEKVEKAFKLAEKLHAGQSVSLARNIYCIQLRLRSP